MPIISDIYINTSKDSTMPQM